MSRPRFHLAFPVHDLESARAFYGGLLGCKEGRSAETWVDFNFFGHQIVTHLSSEITPTHDTNKVNGEDIPVFHFGLLLTWQEWHELAADLKKKNIHFLIEPTIRFSGESGEQGTFFINDPSQNPIEFKAFKDESELFSK